MTSERAKNLGVRILSALAAAGLLVGTYLIFELAGIVILAMVLEALVIKEGLNLINWAPLTGRFKIALGIIFYILFLIFLFWEPYRFQVLTLSLVLGLALSVQINVNKESLQVLQNTQSRMIVAMVYLAFFPALLVSLLLMYQGILWFGALLIMVFAGDIGAYSFGVTLGKRHMLPKISPKKTWEGAFGGFLATLLSAYIIYEMFDLKIPLFGWLLMSSLISLSAQSGDFFESLLKRIVNVKDSGNIMPGHGGILDRIDGLLFAAPIMSVSLTYFDRWI